MESTRAPHVSPLYLLERFDVGVVQLDSEQRVLGMNDYARRVLPVAETQPFDRLVMSFHPERSQPKVEFLLQQAAQCPVANPPPMTMIINIPERVLLIKVTRLNDGHQRSVGYTLVFYDITELVAAEEPPAAQPAVVPAALPAVRRRLQKIPTVSHHKILLVDADDVLCLQSEGHYTRVITAQGNQFCNLSIGDIEARLDPEVFMRVHRSHLVNLQAVTQIVRDDGRTLLRLRDVATPIPVSRTSAAAVMQRLGVPAGSALRPG